MAMAVASVTLSVSKYSTRKTIADRKSDSSCSRAERINGPQGGTKAQMLMPLPAAGIQPGPRRQTCEDVGPWHEQTGDSMVSTGTGATDSATPQPCPPGVPMPNEKGFRPMGLQQPASQQVLLPHEGVAGRRC